MARPARLVVTGGGRDECEAIGGPSFAASTLRCLPLDRSYLLFPISYLRIKRDSLLRASRRAASGGSRRPACRPAALRRNGRPSPVPGTARWDLASASGTRACAPPLPAQRRRLQPAAGSTSPGLLFSGTLFSIVTLAGAGYETVWRGQEARMLPQVGPTPSRGRRNSLAF